MARPHVDESRYPLVTITFEGIPTESDFDDYLRDLTRLIIERKQKTVTLMDGRRSGRAPASQRKKQADWLSRHQHTLRQHSLGTAFVITSPLVRGVLTAIFWLQQMPTDYVIVGTIGEAEAWARARLGKSGLAMPPPRRAAADSPPSP